MSLKESIERELKIPTRIRIGGPGALDIFADGVKIFSKKQTGHMPSVNEVLSLVRSRKPA